MLTIKWYGTNSFKITDGKDEILIDPFIRYEKRNNKVFIKNFNCKNVLITHGHIDHTMDLDYLYKNKIVNIYATNCIYKRLNKKINKVNLIEPNSNIIIGNFNIKVFKSKHIKFDIKLVLSTLFNRNVIKYFKELKILVKNNFICKENNETIAYLININNINIFVLGSMNLDNNTIYPNNIDYLILPYQGSSYLDKKANKVINILKPKNIILSHFDNSFPPISKNIDTNKLYSIINNINIIKPNYEEEIILEKRI